MDELKQLKKDWQKDKTFPKINKSEIYKFLHKKSSSIVKWIFIISIIEFSFWCIISFLIKDNENQQRFDEYGMEYITTPLMITGYVVLFYFFVLFYRNYKSISTTVNSKALMEQILKTRKTINKFGKNTTISVKGRHDPCVGIRAVPVGEAMMNCVLLDHYLMNKAQCT